MEILKVTNLPDKVMLGKFKQIRDVLRGLSLSLSYDDKVCWVTDKVFVVPQYLVVGCLEEGVAYCFAAEIKGCVECLGVFIRTPFYFIRFRVRGLGFTPQKTLKNFLKIPQKFIE